MQAGLTRTLPGQISLFDLVELEMDIVLDKSHSNKDWRQRPLPQEMIDYALSDTEHLHVRPVLL